ncbi:MAG TPA: glycosyltransferase family 8 protein [Devosiaceae bacterium]|nr:glycosyltransferase family 8 protein [Devosiaceae bacterium]
MDQPSPPRIHVALTFNDKYWALAYAVMRSACLTTRRRRDLVFHLCHTALKPHHLEALDHIAEEFGATLVHHDPEQNPAFRELVATLRTSDRFPSIVYARLVLDKLIPPEAGRVIYLDCDVMVCQPIEQLYDADMGGKPIAAVFDPFHMGLKKGRDIRLKPTPFDTGDRYFNSGVLLIDLKRYTAADLPSKIKTLAATGALKNLFFDQDLLNLVFLNNWQPLDWRFNVLDPRPQHEAMHPVIVHYTGHRHPWNIFSGTAFQRLYRHVMTNDIYYTYLAERSPKWLGPLINRARRHRKDQTDFT